MRMETSLNQRLEQKLKLAPQIIQSIEILQLPAIELQDLIRQEMLENPTIELKEGGTEEEEPREEGEESEAAEPPATATIPEVDTRIEPRAESEDTLEADFQKLEDIETAWKDSYSPRSSGMGEDGKDKKLEAMQNTAAKPCSLQDYLFSQFNLLEITEPRQREIGEQIIYSINDDGYFADTQGNPYSLEDLARSMDQPCTVEEMEQVLKIVQTLDPPGVGARNLVECLLLQIGPNPSFAFERLLVEKYLDDLKMNRLPKIAKETGRSLDELKDAIAFIGALNPRPGVAFSGEQPQTVIPDVVVEPVDGKYEVRLEDSYIPRIHISSRYRRMLREEKSNPAVREYIKKKIEAAKWLIESIEQRQNTLAKIAREIVDYQKPFLDKGIDCLRPLKMQQIADKVGVHVSTVSRAISDKYMQSPRGVMPLKFFFTGGTLNAEGEAESILAVKQKVRDIVDGESKKSPLSDEDIALRLKEMGYDIARRTVTKYRKQMGILSSRQRRAY